jgi:hypothetical protein
VNLQTCGERLAAEKGNLLTIGQPRRLARAARSFDQHARFARLQIAQPDIHRTFIVREINQLRSVGRPSGLSLNKNIARQAFGFLSLPGYPQIAERSEGHAPPVRRNCRSDDAARLSRRERIEVTFPARISRTIESERCFKGERGALIVSRVRAFDLPVSGVKKFGFGNPRGAKRKDILSG